MQGNCRIFEEQAYRKVDSQWYVRYFPSWVYWRPCGASPYVFWVSRQDGVLVSMPAARAHAVLLTEPASTGRELTLLR